MQDLTKIAKTPHAMTVTVWMPEEFWRMTLANGGRLNPKAISDSLAALRPYNMFFVLDAETTAFGGQTYPDDATVTNIVRLEDSHGALYQPLDPASLTPDVQSLIAAFRPVMAKMMGDMGQHMLLLVFPTTDKNGQRFAEAASTGSLTVHVGEMAVRYRLPLGSLSPPSTDPKTGESFPGTYHFNPYTGDKLTAGHWSEGAAPTPGH